MTDDEKSKLGFGAERLRPEDEAPTLFRKRYRELSAEELKVHDEIKDTAEQLWALFQLVHPLQKERVRAQLMTQRGDRALSDMAGAVITHLAARDVPQNIQLAKRHLEDAVYRAVKALTT